MTHKIRKNAPHGATHWCSKTGYYWMAPPGGAPARWEYGAWVYRGPVAPKGMVYIGGSGKTIWALTGLAVGMFVVWMQSCN